MNKGIFLQAFTIQNQGDIDRGIHTFGFDLDYHIKKVISDCGVTLTCPCQDCGNGFGASAAPANPVPFGIQAIDAASAAQSTSQVDTELLQAAITMLAQQVAELQAEVAQLKSN